MKRALWVVGAGLTVAAEIVALVGVVMASPGLVLIVVTDWLDRAGERLREAGRRSKPT